MQPLSAALLLSSVSALVTSQATTSGKFRCQTAGFHRDPNNCAIFYRCVSFWGGSQLRPVMFSCKEPTVFDASLRVCQFPWRTKPPCVKNANGVWVEDEARPTVLPPVEVLPNITVIELGSADFVTSPPPTYQVAAGSPYACPGPGEYFARQGDACVFYYQCAETAPGVVNATLFRCADGQIFTETTGACVRPSPLPACGQISSDSDLDEALDVPVQQPVYDDQDLYLELEFRK
ncbi:uncharacterized protein LOC119113923 [Pollicipes pollicipes]|uniref:uncharacterized protein LOC119113923 n=1 Tax=Pollicipes pollicipes TaxID=41117 RepID=UPI0018857B58|nr:uncharacterized protein LOC119113923 [Pollicipes pollicipes]